MPKLYQYIGGLGLVTASTFEFWLMVSSLAENIIFIIGYFIGAHPEWRNLTLTVAQGASSAFSLYSLSLLPIKKLPRWYGNHFKL